MLCKYWEKLLEKSQWLPIIHSLSFRILPFANSSWGTGVQDSNLMLRKFTESKCTASGLLVLKISFSFV